MEISKGNSLYRFLKQTKMSFLFFYNQRTDQVTVAHAYNPSYTGGRDQEDNSSKSAQGK
jgi:hypothetical protein